MIDQDTHEAAAIDSHVSPLEPHGPFMRLSLGADGQNVVTALINQIPDFLFVKDTQTRFVLANNAVAQAYGLWPQDLIGKTDYDLHPVERADQFFAHERDVLRSGIPVLNMEESFPDSAGVPKFYSTTKVPLRAADGTVIGLIGVARDITDRKRTEAFSFQQNVIIEMIAKNEPLPDVLGRLVLLIEGQMYGMRGSILLHDDEHGVLRHGAAPNLPADYCQAIDGTAIGPKVGSCGTAAYRRAPVIVADIQSDPLWEDYRALAAGFGLRSCWCTPIFSHDGTVLGTFAIYAGEVRHPNPDEAQLIEVATRIAGIAIERHRSEQRLIRMAHYDPLTALPNRTLFHRTLRDALDRRRVDGGSVALHLLDLDGFKRVNDQFGHQIGDALLAAVGARLQGLSSPRQIIARLGGDEFAVVQMLRPGEGPHHCQMLADLIVQAVGSPYALGSHQVTAGASVGIVVTHGDDRDTGALLRDADLALYQAKKSRGSVRFYETAMSVHLLQRRSIEDDLRLALDRQQFQLHYQPIIDLATGHVASAEALLRWTHPGRGMVAPLDFIPIAEETGLIVPIGEWVLQEACAQASLWPRATKVAVNLSPAQFKDGGLFQAVLAALAASGLPPERLELEITESVMLLDSDANLALLHRLRKLGVHISLDDFGTGYSSLSYLRSFPLTRIKIDRSFVRDLGCSSGCLAIVRAIARLGSDLDIRTTAEGIETMDQLRQLQLARCTEGQGFLFSKPVPGDQFARHLGDPHKWVAAVVRDRRELERDLLARAG